MDLVQIVLGDGDAKKGKAVMQKAASKYQGKDVALPTVESEGQTLKQLLSKELSSLEQTMSGGEVETKAMPAASGGGDRRTLAERFVSGLGCEREQRIYTPGRGRKVFDAR